MLWSEQSFARVGRARMCGQLSVGERKNNLTLRTDFLHVSVETVLHFKHTAIIDDRI